MRTIVIGIWVLLLAVSTAEEKRTWTSQEGAEIGATYLSHDGESVTLRRLTDLREVRVPIARLTEADQAWLAAKGESGAEAAADAPGEGIFIAVGNGLHRMSSNDGRVWKHHQFADKPGHDKNDLKSIAVGNGVVVTVGGFSRSNILTTADGVDWHVNDFNAGVLSGVIFTDGRFLAFGEGGRVIESNDGMKWELIGDAKLRDYLTREAAELGEAAPIKSNIRAWREADGTFVGSGDNSIIATTKDFEDWSFLRLEPRSRLYIAADGKGFVVRGDRSLHHSADGLTWEKVTPEIGEKVKFNTIAHDGERFLVSSRDGEGWESTDGKKWEPIRGATFSGTIEALRPDLYYAFQTYWKPTEELMISTDGGKSWEVTEIPAPAGVTNIIFAPGLSKFHDD